MRNLMKATGHGLKHFFGARDSVADYKQLGGQFKAGNKVKKARVLAMMGMYTVYKGSPIGLAKNIADSVKTGKWKYGNLKQHQQDVEELLNGTNMSNAGKQAVAALMMHGSDDAVAGLSPADAGILHNLEMDLHIAAGHCINF